MIELDRRRRGQPAGRKPRRGVKMRQRVFFFFFDTDLARARRIKRKARVPRGNRRHLPYNGT